MDKFEIAFIAQETRKGDLIHLIRKYREGISNHSTLTTRETGLLVRITTGLNIGFVEAATEGGYLHIARLVNCGDLRMVIFLHDPWLSLKDIGVMELLQACNMQNVPFANNVATAEFILHRFFEIADATYLRCPEIRIAANLVHV